MNYRDPTLSTFDPPIYGNIRDARYDIAAYLGGWSCEACKRQGTRHTTQAHHIVPKRERLIHSWGNLVLLCPDCHYDLAHQMPPLVRHRSAFLEAMGILRTRGIDAVLEWTDGLLSTTDLTTGKLET